LRTINFRVLFFGMAFCIPNLFFCQQENKNLFEVALKNKSKEFVNEINFNKALLFYFEKNWDSTLVYSMKQLSSKKRTKKLIDYSHFFRGYSFKEKKIFVEAEKELNAISKEFEFSKSVKNILGEIALEQNKFSQAIVYFEEFENISNNNFFNIKKSIVNHNLGICYLHLKKFDKSESYLLKSKKLQEIENDTLRLIGAYGDIATLYYEQFKDNLAIPYFEKAYNLSKKIKNFNLKKTTAYNMAIVEENRKNFEKSIIYRKEAEKWNDSLTDQNKIWAVADVEKKYVVKQKQKEIQILEVENEIKKTERNGLFLLSVLLLSMFGIGIYFYRQKIRTNKIILAQKESLDELNATKDKLFSIVSHDLRSSVNALKTSNTKLLNHLETKNYVELDVLLHRNNAIANSSYNLLDNLLNWAQQQTNQLFFQIESLHLHSIVQQIEYNYKSLMFDKNIALNINIDKSIFVAMDLDSLKIIMRNMLDNALKFSNENGTISIYTKQSTDDYIELVIEDTGIGMSDLVVKELLQETMKLSKKNNKEIIGTGLGLQLCKSMLAKNNGKLDIQSKEGVGTKFILFLPKTTTNG
jgi:signal transduction histidine kinase